jgi:hypothetical protein
MAKAASAVKAEFSGAAAAGFSLADATARVEHAKCTDETRPHMCSVYGVAHSGAWWLGATDGHRAAVARCDEASSVKVQDAPPLPVILDTVIPGARLLGEIDAASDLSIDALRALPASWHCTVELGRDGATLTARRRGRGKKWTEILQRAPLFGGGLRLSGASEPHGINPSYLLDAIDAVGTGTVQVWGAGLLDPLIFTASDRPILSHAVICIVMPVRV